MIALEKQKASMIMNDFLLIYKTPKREKRIKRGGVEDRGQGGQIRTRSRHSCYIFSRINFAANFYN